MDRQDLNMLMSSVGLRVLAPIVSDLASQLKIDELDVIRLTISTGLRAEQERINFVADAEQKKERSKERKTIYNNNKEKPKTKSTFPELTIGVKPVSSTKKPKRQIPKAWIDQYERQVLEDETLIAYCKKRGGDEYWAKEQFLRFVEHHMAKGSMWVRWNYAFYKWITNDIKWNGRPATQKPGSVIQSYKPQNTMKDLFND